MSDLKSFVEGQISAHEILYSCIKVIVYSYGQIVESDKLYSRSGILNEIRTARKSVKSKLELEDYLRNDLVNNYVKKNQHYFNLNNFLFITGPDAHKGNVTIGHLDIKVASCSFSNDQYFVFECKLLNKKLLSKYKTEGIYRFIKRKYYYDSDVPIGGMIAFLTASNKDSQIIESEIPTTLKSIVDSKDKKLKLKEGFRKVKLEYSLTEPRNRYKHVYQTMHSRNSASDSFMLCHVILDYNDLVID